VKIDSSLLFKGQVIVNLSALLGKIVDLQPGDRRNMRVARKGFAEVKAELTESLPTVGSAAGITNQVVDDFIECSNTIDAFDAALSVVGKLAEVIVESRAYYENMRQNLVALIVETVRVTARHRNDPAILAPFEKAIEYHGRVGFKAARTRRRNQQEAANAQIES